MLPAAPPHATRRSAVLLCPCGRGGVEGARWRGRQSTSRLEGVDRQARWPSAAGMVKSTLLMSKRYCDAVGKEAIKPTTPTLMTQRRRSSRYSRIPGGTARDVGSWWRRRRRVDVGGLRATRQVKGGDRHLSRCSGGDMASSARRDDSPLCGARACGARL